MANLENDQDDWLEKLTTILEQNILGVKLGIYGVALCGLGIAFRSVRPFQKFTSPKDIPKSFVDKNIRLTGKVLRVDYAPKTLLVVDHQPIFGSSFRKPNGLLVNVEGINILGNGISWLQYIVVGSDIDFVLLSKDQKYVNCIVYQKKRNIGNYLVSLGFASVAPYNFSLEDCKEYTTYYGSLLKEEDKAEKKGAGIWWDKQRSSWFIDFVTLKLLPLFKSRKSLLRLK